jgi:hydroxyacylglutathione hydrolase
MTQDLTIEPIPAFADNYLWLLVRRGEAAIVDPGDPAPVLQHLQRQGLTLAAILVTHHHGDHVGGVNALRRQYRVPVLGPAREDIAGIDTRLGQGDRCQVLGVPFEVLDVPGHTAGHIAFHAPARQVLFCGDTLFAAGCGRLFEGTPAQMLDSLDRLAALPPDTRGYCAHEYTLANLRFAAAVEPGNADVDARRRRCEALRAAGRPTLPFTLRDELATNPFLRVDQPAVKAAAERRQPGASTSRAGTFAALRAWKDDF